MPVPPERPGAARAPQRGPRRLLPLLGLPLLLLPAQRAAAAPGTDPPARRFTAELDAFVLSGEFGGEETTDILYVPLILRSWGARHEFSVVIPYLSIEGPAGVVGGERSGVPTSGRPAGEVESRSGPGDVVLRGEYFALAGDGRRRPWISGLLRLKIPTASDAEGLGTGEFDVSAGVSYTQPWGERMATFLDLVRKRVGDPPGTDFRDTTGVVLGVSGRASRAVSLYLVYDREDSIVGGLEDGESLVAGLMLRPAEGWRLSAALFRGLSDTREDSGGMLGLARTWDAPARPRP